MIAAFLLAAAATPEVFIPYIGRDGVREFRADGRQGIYIRDIRGHWYYARFIAPCARLPDQSGLTFDASPIDRLDRDSAVIAGGEFCRFKTFDRSGPPPKRRRPR